MAIYLAPSLVRNFVYPVYRGFRKDMVLSILDELERSQWLSEEEIKEIQWSKLVNLIRQSARHVPYYRELFERRGIEAGAIDSPSDFRQIPFLTRNLIRENKSGILSGDPLRKGLPMSSGGSYGDILHFNIDLASSPVRRANTLRQMRTAGVDIGERQLQLLGFDPERQGVGNFRGLVKNYFHNIKQLSAFDMSEKSMVKYASTERSFRPSVIVAYPSALAYLAEFCGRNSINLHSPKAIIARGEILYPHQRKILEEVFSSPVYDHYGSMEFSNIAAECEEHDGMHIAADLFYTEVIKSNGQPAENGEVGELVVTDLTNFYMPFIRYRTGDLAVPSAKRCPCGRGLPLIEKIEGKKFDAVKTPEGKLVGGFYWHWLSKSVPGIDRFQVEQKSLTTVEFKIVTGAGWSEESLDTLKKEISSNCGDDLVVEFNIVEDIPLAQSGKARFVVSRLKERLVIKSKIHKANVTSIDPGAGDCLKIDGKLMDLANLADFEQILIVNSTNGARLETFAVRGPSETGEIVACGGVANKALSEHEIGIMAFTWSDDPVTDFSNILVDRENRFVRHLTEVPGEII